MGEHDAFGIGRGTGGIADVGHIVRSDRGIACHEGFAVLLQEGFAGSHHLRNAYLLLFQFLEIEGSVIKNDDLADSGAGRQDGSDLRQLVGRNENPLGIGVVDAEDQVRVIQQRRSLMVFHDLGSRTAHVDIDTVKVGGNSSGCLGHDIRLGAEQLAEDGSFFSGMFQKKVSIFVMVVKPFGTHHFRIDKAGPVSEDDAPEGRICDACHGGGHDPAADRQTADRKMIILHRPLRPILRSAMIRSPSRVRLLSYVSICSISFPKRRPKPPVATTFISGMAISLRIRSTIYSTWPI